MFGTSSKVSTGEDLWKNILHSSAHGITEKEMMHLKPFFDQYFQARRKPEKYLVNRFINDSYGCKTCNIGSRLEKLKSYMQQIL